MMAPFARLVRDRRVRVRHVADPLTHRMRACNFVAAASCVQHSPLVAATSIGRHIMLGLGTGTRSGARLGVLAASVALVISMLPAATVLAAGETLTFSVQPGGAVSGAAFTVQPQVTLNTPASGGTVSLAIGAGSPSGTLVGCLVPTFAASPGIFTFSGCRIDQAGAGYVLVATWSLNGSVTHTSAAFTVSAGAFAKLQVLVPGETAAPGTTTGKTDTPPLAAGPSRRPISMTAPRPRTQAPRSPSTGRSRSCSCSSPAKRPPQV